MESGRRSVCVFCGSREGARPAYGAAAKETGQAIAEAGWRLVFGAGDVGLMGRAARAAKAAGGETFGVIPEHLLEIEAGRRDLSALVITETMHERKKVMFMNSDAIVMLPGGVGSLDEFFEMLTWSQLGLHKRPILLLNTEGYWDPLSRLLHHVAAEGFTDTDTIGKIGFTATVPHLMASLHTALG